MFPFRFRKGFTYEYWTRLTDVRTTLIGRDRARYLALPPPSAELREWLAQRVERDTPSRDATRILVQHFRENHEYELGAPDLDLSAPSKPLLHFIWPPDEPVLDALFSAAAERRRRAGVPDGGLPSHWMEEVESLRRMARRRRLLERLKIWKTRV